MWSCWGCWAGWRKACDEAWCSSWIEVTNPASGPAEMLKKEGFLCKSSCEVCCSLLLRLQDMQWKAGLSAETLCLCSNSFPRAAALLYPSSFLPELHASKDVCLAGCLATNCPWSSLDHRTIGLLSLERTSGYLCLNSSSTQDQLWIQTSLLRAAYELLGICLHHTGIAAILYWPLTPWALWFVGGQVQTQQLPVFQTAEDAEAMLPN